MPSHTLHHGDCLAVLKTLPDNSIESIVTDPPAGISFMGKDWDQDKGGRTQWVAWMTTVARECIRVLKPGGHALVWAIPRTSHWTGWAWEDAGWEPRDCVLSLNGMGFPKSKNVALSIDKGEGHPNRGRAIPTASKHLPGGKYETEELTSNPVGPYEPKTDNAKPWVGWGTALKPSQEIWWLFRKPLEGTVAENVLTYGTGAINVDGCRVGNPFVSAGGNNFDAWRKGQEREDRPDIHGKPTANIVSGRWPSNLVLTHSPGCKPLGTRTVPAPVINRFDDGMKPFGNGAGHPYTSTGGGTEEIPVYECVPWCPVKTLDEQSGIQKDGVATSRGVCKGYGEYGAVTYGEEGFGYGGGGGASRFFPTFAFEEDDFVPFLYTAKASRSERNEGLSHPNAHPTVKPISLMRWLVKLITPPGGTVLDPFTGSGTTGCACMYEGMNFLGIEQDETYLNVARERISYHDLKTRGGVPNPFTQEPPKRSREEIEALTDLFALLTED